MKYLIADRIINSLTVDEIFILKIIYDYVTYKNAYKNFKRNF